LGCSTTSTIARVNGPPIEGDIVGGSRETIFVRSDDDREFEIPREEISSVDYPGNVHANVGAGVLAYGVLNIAVGLPKCNEQTDSKAAYCTGVFLPAAIGAGMIIWGLLVHHGQTSAFDDTSRESLLQKPPPRVPQTSARPLPAATDERQAPPAPSTPPTPTTAPAPTTPPPPAASFPPLPAQTAAPAPAPSPSSPPHTTPNTAPPAPQW
jgi:hypothetical protein